MNEQGSAWFVIGMIFSIISLAYIPYVIYQIFAGEERAEKYLEEIDFPIKGDTLNLIGTFCIMIAVGCLVTHFSG